MLVCPMDNTVVWFCSLYKKATPDMKQILQRYHLINLSNISLFFCIICNLLNILDFSALTVGIILEEDPYPPPKTSIGYILRYVILNLILK